MVVAEDESLGVTLLQLGNQGKHGALLCLGARVCRMSVGVQSAFVADAYGMAVVATAMCSWDSLGAAAFYGAVTKDDIVIAYVGPTKAAMPAAYPGGGGRLLRPYTGAVDDNQGYSTHNGEREVLYRSHTGGDAEDGGYGGEYGDCKLEELFPNGLFHNCLVKLM